MGAVFFFLDLFLFGHVNFLLSTGPPSPPLNITPSNRQYGHSNVGKTKHVQTLHFMLFCRVNNRRQK